MFDAGQSSAHLKPFKWSTKESEVNQVRNPFFGQRFRSLWTTISMPFNITIKEEIHFTLFMPIGFNILLINNKTHLQKMNKTNHIFLTISSIQFSSNQYGSVQTNNLIRWKFRYMSMKPYMIPLLPYSNLIIIKGCLVKLLIYLSKKMILYGVIELLAIFPP